jgi:cysteinyl-tRNA synthetase
MHHGFVTIKDEKMSKSLGNFLTIRDVLDQYEPEVLRLFIYSTQYRNPLDFSEAALQDAEAGLERMYGCLAGVADLPAGSDAVDQVISAKDRKKLESLKERFCSAMDSDFNSAQALGHLFDGVKVLNKLLHMLPEQPAGEDVVVLQGAATELQELAGVLGLLQQDPTVYLEQRQAALLAGIDLSAEQIEEMIARRNDARAAKDWTASDAIRDDLLARGIALKDGAEGTTWEVQ